MQLSDVGQTYGAASAILAALALGGVAVSLVLQRRESKAAREQALRGLHTDLLRMSLDDPEFMECWGIIGKSVDRSWHRQHIYLNLIVSHWQMMWEIGALTEEHVRILARGIFRGPLGFRYWKEARDVRLVAEKGRAARDFHAIVDDEFLRARPPVPAEADNNIPAGMSSGRHAESPRSNPGVAAVRAPAATRQGWRSMASPLAWFGLGAAVAWTLRRTQQERTVRVRRVGGRGG